MASSSHSRAADVMLGVAAQQKVAFGVHLKRRRYDDVMTRLQSRLGGDLAVVGVLFACAGLLQRAATERVRVEQVSA